MSRENSKIPVLSFMYLTILGIYHWFINLVNSTIFTLSFLWVGYSAPYWVTAGTWLVTSRVWPCEKENQADNHTTGLWWDVKKHITGEHNLGMSHAKCACAQVYTGSKNVVKVGRRTGREQERSRLNHTALLSGRQWKSLILVRADWVVEDEVSNWEMKWDRSLHQPHRKGLYL